MPKPNEEGAIALATAMYSDIESYKDAHGASSTVIDGLWALAHLAAYLILSHGVDKAKARAGFLRALDYALDDAPHDCLRSLR